MRSISQTTSVIDCCNRKLDRAHKLLESQFTSEGVWVTSGCCFGLGITGVSRCKEWVCRSPARGAEQTHTHAHSGTPEELGSELHAEWWT